MKKHSIFVKCSEKASFICAFGIALHACNQHCHPNQMHLATLVMISTVSVRRHFFSNNWIGDKFVCTHCSLKPAIIPFIIWFSITIFKIVKLGIISGFGNRCFISVIFGPMLSGVFIVCCHKISNPSYGSTREIKYSGSFSSVLD